MKAARNNTNVLDGVSIDSVDKKSGRYSIAALLGMFALGTIVGIGMNIVGIRLSSWTPKSGAAFRNPSADISETVRVTDRAVEVEAETVENLLTVPESYDADVSNGESLKSHASRALKSEKNKNQKSRIFRKTSSNGSTKKKTVKKVKKAKKESACTSSPTTEPTNPPTTNSPVTAPPTTNPPVDKNCPCGVARCDNFYSCSICGIGRCITNPEYVFDPGYDGSEGRPRPPRTCGQAEAVAFQGTLNGPGTCFKLHVPEDGSTLFDEKYPGCTCSALLPTPEPTTLPPTETPYPTDNPSDSPTLSANPTSCVAILDNLVESSFNPVGLPYCFGVSEGDFLNAELTVVSGSGAGEKSTTDFEFTPGVACTTNLFTEDNGPVDITFEAEADCGNVQLSASLISGSVTVTVKLEKDNILFTDKAEARASSADISDVVAIYQILDGSGTATFQNLPKRSVTFTATGEGYEFGASGATLSSNTDLDIDLFGFNEPSDIDNNDFELGLEGWDFKPEQEYAIGIKDNNLVVTTGGKEGLTRVSRTLTTSAVTTNMKVHYRFATEEFPQFFGDIYNDYFFVLIRVIPPATGPMADIASFSMNNLGFDAFKHSFYASKATATDWDFLEFGGIPQGSIVQVDIGVANVADGSYDSAVEVDYVELAEG